MKTKAEPKAAGLQGGMGKASHTLGREDKGAPFAAMAMTAGENAATRIAIGRGLEDILHGRYQSLDTAGLNKLGRQLVARAAKKGA